MDLSSPYSNEKLLKKIFIILALGALSLICIKLYSVFNHQEFRLVSFIAFIKQPWINVHDSWHPIEVALENFRNGESLYALFETGLRFQYPASSIIPFYFYMPSYEVLNFINYILVLLNLLFFFLILKNFIASKQGQIGSKEKLYIYLSIGLISLFFFPLYRAYLLGQIQVFLNLLFSLSILTFMAKRFFWTGVSIGLICLIKPQFCLFLFWALIRKHWEFLKGFILIGVIGFFVTLAIFGFDSFIDYYHVLRSLSQTGESYADNQSINGMMHRMLFNGNNLEWIPTVFPPYNHTVYLTTVISSAALILLALFQKSPRDERTALLDYLVVGLAFTTASPVAWQHHYSLLIPIYGITLVTMLLITDRRKKLGFIALWLVSIFLVFLPTEITYAYAYTWFNFVQSSMLIGVLLILFTTYILRHEKSVGIQRPNPS